MLNRILSTKGKLRGALAVMLVAVFLVNQIIVKAEAPEPSITVNTYADLVIAINNALEGDIIGIGGNITIPEGSTLGDPDKKVTLKRLDPSYYLLVDYRSSGALATIQNIVFEGNRGEIGGSSSFVQIGSNAEITGCEFNNCESSGAGGALWLMYSTKVKVKQCSFKNNKAYNAGAVNVGSGELTEIDQCTFTGNEAEYRGGAVDCGSYYPLKLSNCKIVENKAELGGGISSVGSSVDLSYTLIYNNTATSGGADISLENGASYTNTDTMDQYNAMFYRSGLYPLGWEDDTREATGGGTYLVFKTSTEDPYAQPTPDPETPPADDPTPEPENPPQDQPTDNPPAQDPVTPNSGGDTTNNDNHTEDNSSHNSTNSHDNSTTDNSTSTNTTDSHNSTDSHNTEDHSSYVGDTKNDNRSYTYNTTTSSSKTSTGGNNGGSQLVEVTLICQSQKRAEMRLLQAHSL